MDYPPGCGVSGLLRRSFPVIPYSCDITVNIQLSLLLIPVRVPPLFPAFRNPAHQPSRNPDVTAALHQPPQLARANGIELCYEIFGAPDAEPLLLIMGLGAQMIHWDDDFCRQLAARGLRVIRFDNRDIGQSTKLTGGKRLGVLELLKLRIFRVPVSATYTLRDMAKDTVGLLDALHIKSAHIVGASMGGMIAQEIAITFPERVRSLTSIMSTTGNPKVPPPTREASALLMAPPVTERDEFIRRFAQTWKLLRGGSFPEDEAMDRERAIRTFERGLNPAGVGRQLRAILASGSRKERLASVKAPTLVIHGTVDPLVRPEGGKDTAASIPGAKLLMIEGMGHALPIPMWPQIIDAIDNHAHGAEAH
ncbi:MAG: alpha/beta hydrolase [Rhizobiales bacterium]|nr:alpha/beta hydrolase [Hyphomicrobiales bacterium]